MPSSLEKYNEKIDVSSKSYAQLYSLKNDLQSYEYDTKVTSELTSGAMTTRVEQINIDGVVNTNMLHAHLSMLAKFKALEQQNSEIDERFLLRAEKRYLLWLKLLNNMSFKENDVPIPPIDVCQVWHAHLLSPLRYFEDIKRLYNREYIFPLAKLHELWSQNNGEHIDERSKKLWEENTKQPWVLDPYDTSEFELVCPYCSTTLSIAANSYVKLMRNPKHSEICNKCECILSIDSMSAKRFIDDIYKYDDGKKVYIAGTLVSPSNGEYDETKAISDSDYLFDLTSTHWKNLIIGIAKNPKTCSWTKIVKCIKSRINELKSQLLFKNVRIGITQNVILAYCSTPLPFSIGLVSAVIRQRDFTNKMVNNTWINNSSVQSQAITRYHKFLLLQKDANKCFVPTLDIDICWHTHMLYAPLYRNFTKNHMNRIINHDDTLSKPTLSNGFAQTSSAWYKKFNEPYTCEHPKRYWLTTNKKVAAIIFPPYAIYLVYKLNKFKKGMIKKDKTQNSSSLISEKTGDNEINKYTGACGISPGFSFIYGLSLVSPTPFECKGTCGTPATASCGGGACGGAVGECGGGCGGGCGSGGCGGCGGR